MGSEVSAVLEMDGSGEHPQRDAVKYLLTLKRRKSEFSKRVVLKRIKEWRSRFG